MAFQQFQKLVQSGWQFNLFMLLKLPSAYLCGVRVQHLSEAKSVVTIPFWWLSQNPFRSIYFACQAMAAEMSTGLPALGFSYKSQPAISMLVVGFQANFYKKASSKIWFTCENGLAIKEAIAKASETGEGQTIETLSVGKNKSGELISEFSITWSFKAKMQTNPQN